MSSNPISAKKPVSVRMESSAKEAETLSVARHKAAIRRTEMSLPVKCLIRDRILEYCTSFFDYGCGYGEDVQQLRNLGFDSDGWDPVYRENSLRRPADAVNIGYVLNVVEDAKERSETLRHAWALCQKVMAVAARIVIDGRGATGIEFGDGILTQIGTFQKFYTQTELHEYIETQLQTDAIPAAPGVFYVFRDEELRQHFLASRYRRRSVTPRKRASEIRFEEHRQILEPLMGWIADRGRLPEPDEFSDARPLQEEFGSLKRAFALIRRVTGAEEWDCIREKSTEDLLVYLALANFRLRPRFSRLPLDLQRDIRCFFGTYKKACQRADEMLFRAGNADAIDQACKSSPLGKLLPYALYVHQSALDELDPLLRIYEGCARAYTGEIDGANVIKLHRFSGKISYLVYPDFEKHPHPALLRCLKLSLRTRQLEYYDYGKCDNPPILHRKELFVHPDHPLHAKFVRLTVQEERHGLLKEASRIGLRKDWEQRLEKAGAVLRGHRILRQGKK